MSYLNGLIAATKNKLATVASDGLYTDDVIFTDTGSYILNALLSGSIYKGIPGRITMFAGPPSTGKTFFLLSIAKNFIEEGKRIGEERFVVYFESEGAITTELLESRGFSRENIGVVPVGTLEQFRTQCLRVVEEYRPNRDKYKLLLCLDSFGMLSSEKEVEDSSEGKSTRDMTKAQLAKGIFRVITLSLAELGLGLLVTNHVYSAVGSYIPTNVIGGGSGAQYSSSQIVELSKRAEREEKEQTGVILKAKMNKSRITREGKVVEILLDFNTGLDRYYGLTELALKHGLFKNVSTRIELPDGSKQYGKTIRENPEKFFTDDILQKLDEIAKAEFKYGSNLINSDELDIDQMESELES